MTTLHPYQSSEYFWVWDKPGGQFSFIQQGIEEILGLTAESILSDPEKLLSHCHESHRHDVKELLERNWQNQDRATFRTTDGLWIQASWSDNGGQCFGYFKPSGFDEQSAKLMIELAERSDTILRTAISPYALLNTDGYITNFNPAFAEMLGYTQNEVQGRYLPDYSQRTEAVEDFLREVVLKAQLKMDLELTKKNGSKVLVECSAAIVSFGSKSMIVSFFNDISTRVQAQIELLDAIAQKETTNRIKQELLAKVTHELKSPIKSILGVIDILEQGSFDNEADYFSMIRFNSNRLLSSLQYVIEISRMQAEGAGPELKAVDLNDAIEELEPGFAKQISDKKLQLKITPAYSAVKVPGDRFILQEIFRILVGNAIKFTPSGQVNIAVRESSEGQAEIHVVDTGIGIGSEFLEELFQPFTQESSGFDRSHEGLGLGLTLAKHYVELHQGELVVESEKGKGTHVIVRLPSSN